MRRSIVTLASISVLALGACSSGGGDTDTSPSTSTSTSTSASSSSEPPKAKPSDATEASADAAKESAANEAAPTESAANETTPTESPSTGAAPEPTSEDGGIPGGGLEGEEFTTEGYLEDTWAMAEEADDGSTGMTCLVFRAEPDAELELGEDALIDNIQAEVVGIDREEARKFFDKKCPTADEIEAASEAGDQ